MSRSKLPKHSNQLEQESQAYEEQQFERQLITMLNTISQCLQIPLPQNPFSFQYINTIMKRIFPDNSQYKAKDWAEFIKFLQENVTQEVAELQYLPQNKENTEEIFQILTLLTDIAKVAAGAEQQQQSQSMDTGQGDQNERVEQQKRRQQAINQSQRYLKSVKQQLAIGKQKRSNKQLKTHKQKLFNNQKIKENDVIKYNQRKIKQIGNKKEVDKSKRRSNGTRPSTAVNGTNITTSINKGNKGNQNSSQFNRNRSKYPNKVDSSADIGTQVLRTVKESMTTYLNKRDPKTCKLMHDGKGDEAVNKAKRVFDYELDQYRRQLKRAKQIRKSNQFKVYNNKSGQKANQNQFIDSSYLKYIAKKHKNMQEAIINQQLQYYITLRDKKLNYIKNIHNLMVNLQKQRQIDLHKQQIERQKKQKQTIKKKIDAIQNVFTGNLQHLKDQYKNRKKNYQVKGVNQVKFCREIQRQMVKKKQKQMNEMKILWEQQCRKLQGITGDQLEIQKKLLKIYRENKV